MLAIRLRRANSLRVLIPCGNQPENKIRPKGLVLFSGDLCESRTRIDGMKTRCTNRYTKRPAVLFYYIKIP